MHEWVQSAFGIGTENASRSGVTSTPSRGIRVLLAEDDHDVRVGLAELLALEGYQVHAVSNGAQLLDALSSWILASQPYSAPIDVIITDVRMPGFNGLNIVEGLRASGFRQPVVVISAFGDDAMEARIKRLPNVAFVPKPFDLKTIEDAFESLRGT